MYKLTQRKGRCVQCMFDSSGKWISTGCHDRKSAMEWAEARDDRLLFRNFAKDFFIREDEDSLRWWNVKKRREYSPDYYSSRQSILDLHRRQTALAEDLFHISSIIRKIQI